MNKWLVFATIFSLAGSLTQAQAAGDAASGKAKSASCAGCHGADGNSVNPEWPSLAGQGPGYLAKQLHDFKDGKRENVTMSPMAAPLTDADIEDLAAFFSSQTLKEGAAAETLVEQGEKIYRGGNLAGGVAACIGCHGPTGAGNPAAKFPSLSGQQAKYVENQLTAFKSDTRNNDAGKMMRSIAAKMSEKEIQAVSSYVQGLH